MADIDHATNRPTMERWLTDDHDAFFHGLQKYHDFHFNCSGAQNHPITSIKPSASLSVTHPSRTSLPSLSTGSATSKSTSSECSGADTVTTSQSSPLTVDLARVINQTSEILDILPRLTTFQELVNFTRSWIHSTVLDQPTVINITNPTDGGATTVESQQVQSDAANDGAIADGPVIQSGGSKKRTGGKRKRDNSPSSVHDGPRPSRRRQSDQGSSSRTIPCIFDKCKSDTRDWRFFRFLVRHLKSEEHGIRYCQDCSQCFPIAKTHDAHGPAVCIDAACKNVVAGQETHGWIEECKQPNKVDVGQRMNRLRRLILGDIPSAGEVPTDHATTVPAMHNALADEITQLMIAMHSRIFPLLNSMSQEAIGEILRSQLVQAVSDILARGNSLVQPHGSMVVDSPVPTAAFVALEDVEMRDAAEVATILPCQESYSQDMVMQDTLPVESADVGQVDGTPSEAAYLEFLSSYVQDDSGYGTQS